MTIECISQNIRDAGEQSSQYAFTQNKEGIVDLTVGKWYTVYGVITAQTKEDLRYAVLTDRPTAGLPWFMPAKLFKVVDSKRPQAWREIRGTAPLTNEKDREILIADPLYYDAFEDIEDGTKRGHEAFEDIRKEPESLNREATIRDLLGILRSPDAAENINWGELFESKASLSELVKRYVPEYDYLLDKGVIISEYDRETLVNALKEKASVK